MNLAFSPKTLPIKLDFEGGGKRLANIVITPGRPVKGSFPCYLIGAFPRRCCRRWTYSRTSLLLFSHPGHLFCRVITLCFHGTFHNILPTFFYWYAVSIYSVNKKLYSVVFSVQTGPDIRILLMGANRSEVAMALSNGTQILDL